MTTTLNLQELYETDILVNGSKEGFRPQEPIQEYVEPFLGQLQGDYEDLTIRVTKPVALQSNDENADMFKAFGHVFVECKMKPKEEISGFDHYPTIGLICLLDRKTPIAKSFWGFNAHACTNLGIMDADQIMAVELGTGLGALQSFALHAKDELENRRQEFIEFRNLAKSLLYEGPRLMELCGELITRSLKIKELGAAPVLFAIKELYTTDSPYAIEDRQSDAWNLYSATTQYLTNNKMQGNFRQLAEKTLAVTNLFQSLIN